MGRDDSRVTLPEIDLGPWVGPPLEDQTADGGFRRAVADLTRDVLASFAAGGARSADAADGAGAAPGAGAVGGADAAGPAGPLSRGHFDVRATTPYLLVRAYRRTGRSLASERDLLRRLLRTMAPGIP